MDVYLLVGNLYKAFAQRPRPAHFINPAFRENGQGSVLDSLALPDIGLAELGGGCAQRLDHLGDDALAYCLPRLLELALMGLHSHDGQLFAEHLLQLLGSNEERERFESYSEAEVMAVLDALDYLYIELGEQMTSCTLDDALMFWAEKVC
ncbi:hypothetical protein [Parathalassolituus penaei]|uniref:Uncharacterized protein n=1 Tax=Parathalassolituus penaei TaxID=2997323 RepID=A0A9X3IR30_9GAMM|nr:hypothetical protein [Parathalassolituus penaei]MCY0963800.1 hypothetical protein [Parathalassolituus penaei]